MNNPWLFRIGKKQVLAKINNLLKTFVGRRILFLDDILEEMREITMEYFKKNKDALTFFPDDELYDYKFIIEQQQKIITNVQIKCQK
jgi:hypothetical protein